MYEVTEGRPAPLQVILPLYQLASPLVRLSTTRTSHAALFISLLLLVQLSGHAVHSLPTNSTDNSAFSVNTAYDNSNRYDQAYGDGGAPPLQQQHLQQRPQRYGNCFARLDDGVASSLVGHDATTASVTLCVECGGQVLRDCLVQQQQQEQTEQLQQGEKWGKTDHYYYEVIVEGDSLSAKYIHPVVHRWTGSVDQLLLMWRGSLTHPIFHYVIYGGRYRLKISSCHKTRLAGGGSGEEFWSDGECGSGVYTGYISLQTELFSWCQPDNLHQEPTNSSLSTSSTASRSSSAASFTLTYQPCSQVHTYDTANVTLYEMTSAPGPNDEDRGEVVCGGGEGSLVVARETVRITPPNFADGLATDGLGFVSNITYTSPTVRGDHYYCIVAELNHITCLLPAVNTPPPTVCRLTSQPVWVGSQPLLAQLLPFCHSHLSCGWAYIVIGGTAILLVSLCLAIVCVRCCDRKGRKKQSFIHDEVDFAGGEVINLTSSLPERRTWQEVHQEWHQQDGDSGGERRTRGKILLLYSPDTKLFKELQEALKSFLDLACHCDIYDLFDDALFDTIALDPAEWLQQFTKDSDVKIIIISSIGAYRRQMALQLKMPLNLPENSLLDGLFTSGLKFVSSHPELATSGRVATARYEMLHLTEEGHRLGPPVGGGANNEFLIPTQLHELFCWVHQLQPLDLMGKPWANYHLELQLLQDALKLVRRDRTLITTNNINGNGITQI